ncbi:MAG: haloacid dehalogenase type II [Rhodospirillaceae bacterium]|nr:haloacid dehalogenase type II [Rhodospirillaceae bacterium]
MAETTIKALVFDVFGTVVDWRNSIAREAEATLSPKGVVLDWLVFADRWRGKYQPSMERVRSGHRGYVRLDVLHHENLLEVLDEFGVMGLAEADTDHLNKAWHRLDPWPDCVEGLTRLKTRYILGTMSNGNVALMVNMAKHAGLPWDVILGAEPAQAYKPQPDTYLTGVDWLGLEPGEVLMCAAHNDDLLAARDCGLKTAFIARPREYGPDQDWDFKAEHDFDHITESMIDLAEQMGC